eukprot:305057_1
MMRSRRDRKRKNASNVSYVTIPDYFWMDINSDNEKTKAECIDVMAELCCYRSFGNNIELQIKGDKTVDDFIESLLQILGQEDHSDENILKILVQIITSDNGQKYISKHKNNLLLILMTKQWKLKSIFFIKLLTNILYELWLKEEIELHSNQFKSFLLSSLHNDSTEATKESTLKFIAKTITEPHQIIQAFNDDKLVQLIINISKDNCLTDETRNVAAQCIYIAIKIDANIIDNDVMRLNKFVYNAYNSLQTDSNIFDAINPYVNTRLSKHFDELNWLQSLKVGAKLDGYSNKMCNWKICTIINVIIKNEFMMECTISYDRLSDGTNEKRLISLITVLKNTILPLNTKTIFHQHFRPYTQNISKFSICNEVNFENNKHNCHLCNIIMCECALIESPIAKDLYACRTCIVNYEKQQIILSIIESNIELDIDSINVISEYALGFQSKCCNEEDKKCNNIIKLNNTYELMKHFDNRGKKIYSYIPNNKYNKLKSLYVIPRHYKYFSIVLKRRIFCSKCTYKQLNECDMHNCNIKDTKMISKGYGHYKTKYCSNHPRCCICGHYEQGWNVKLSECKMCNQKFCGHRNKCGDVYCKNCGFK